MTVARLARIVRQRLRSLLRPRNLDRELERELAFHAEALIAEHRARGLSDADARLAGARVFGDVKRIGEACRDARGLRWLDDFRQDAAFALRMLRTQRLFALVASLSLALGIGATAAVLRAMDAVRGESLHLADAGRYVSIQGVSPSGEPAAASAIEFAAWRGETLFASIAASRRSQVTLDAEPDRLVAARASALNVTADFFEASGTPPLVGRAFVSSETRLRDPVPAVVISEPLWRTRYASDPRVVGRAIAIDGQPRAVVGVMPAATGWRDPGVDVWLPMRLIPTDTYGRGRNLQVIGRLQPGVTLARAQAALDSVAAGMGRERPQMFGGWTVRVESLASSRLGWTRRPLRLLLAMAGLVLLIACANVGGLLVARASARDREIHVRIALGCGPSRLARQWITEGLMLGGLGSAFALAVTWIGLRSLAAMFPPPAAPPIAPLGLDWRTAALTGAVALVAALLATVVPTSLLSGTAVGPRAWPRAGRAMVVVQVAVAFVIVATGGLLLHSLVRLGGRDLGFAPDHLLAFDVAVPADERNLDAYQGQPYFRTIAAPAERLARFVDDLRNVPGVAALGASSFRAVDAFVISRCTLDAGAETWQGIPCAAVTPGYFAAMHTPVVRGRDIAASDSAATRWVAVVNEAAAARFWPGGNPVGRTITVQNVPDEQPRTVVGVVADMPLRHAAPAEPIVYLSYLQQPAHVWRFGSMNVVARVTGDPSSIAAALQRRASRVDPHLALASMAPVEQQLATGRAGLSTVVRLACVLAATGLLLAGIGVYGVVAHGVGRQMRDTAIRKALGADTPQLIASVSGRVVSMLAAGVALGAVGAFPMAYTVRRQLWGISWTDPVTYSLACLLVVFAAVLAALGPTRQAVRVDPTAILRSE